MTLTGAFLDMKKGKPHWIAVWRTEGGNTIHQRLDMDYLGTSEVDAWVYALDHCPERDNLR